MDKYDRNVQDPLIEDYKILKKKKTQIRGKNIPFMDQKTKYCQCSPKLIYRIAVITINIIVDYYLEINKWILTYIWM